ncbi:hypothetical protein HELRODRAFT_184416 [Helobdella robusta]|uniref:Uncharacterized protein n=1 Tax=Helobdella robusta TaxID=6412 RepID=T1FL58_HELRO|nr:hypothetical protein HELRODRAFT_184416 [Helobdella robusta]ESN98017.1 hypothetical protein HELRODRAFT_184416 [Helobdella robusta]
MKLMLQLLLLLLLELLLLQLPILILLSPLILLSKGNLVGVKSHPTRRLYKMGLDSNTVTTSICRIHTCIDGFKLSYLRAVERAFDETWAIILNGGTLKIPGLCGYDNEKEELKGVGSGWYVNEGMELKKPSTNDKTPVDDLESLCPAVNHNDGNNYGKIQISHNNNNNNEIENNGVKNISNKMEMRKSGDTLISRRCSSLKRLRKKWKSTNQIPAAAATTTTTTNNNNNNNSNNNITIPSSSSGSILIGKNVEKSLRRISGGSNFNASGCGKDGRGCSKSSGRSSKFGKSTCCSGCYYDDLTREAWMKIISLITSKLMEGYHEGTMEKREKEKQQLQLLQQQVNEMKLQQQQQQQQNQDSKLNKVI